VGAECRDRWTGVNRASGRVVADREVVGPDAEEVPSVSLEAWEWLGRRTYHRDQFDPADLVTRKGAATVSVVLPALDEERTVGALVSCFRTELMEAVPLVDELVVIDPGSRDRTAEVAAQAGARVVAEADVLPELGRIRGKGEAMWKSLAATSGDLVVWVDADVENPDPSFVYAMLGPLLTDPAVHYVKGFYERPLAERDRLRPTGGGRVTELVARPWLNLFWPELAGVVQPLAGEQAGRRATLEALPFASHYGVEIGLLLDVLDRHGLDAIAQVDLDRRVHRNQPVPQLGRMAFVIQQAILTRLVRQGRLSVDGEWSTVLHQFTNRERDYRMTPHELPCVDRPPMVSVPGYRP
jgi:glucosyl-3-phosphoglycerate synthase